MSKVKPTTETSIMCTDLRTASSPGILPQNKQAADGWNAGGADYDRISRQIADAIEHCVDRLDPKPGESILDVATGTGWTARRTSARGARVTGIDFSVDLVRAACRLDQSASAYYRVADAEALPFADGEFDAVVSTFGVMFCSDPVKAAAELARVCRPGGRLALTSWEKHGGAYEMFKIIEHHNPQQASRSTSPFDWSDPERLRALLGDKYDLGFEQAVSFYREETAKQAWEAFSQGFGPVRSVLARLDQGAATAFRRDFETFHEQHRTGAGVLVPRPYVVTVGTRHK
jgi:ubiquinone/menaquinone biosynthesis C-methylase UbiE